MHATERRIRKLRLHAGDDSGVAPAVSMLEDAFRTASLAGLPQHALVLVRHLDLGRLELDASPVVTALTIDEKLRQLAGRAECADVNEVGEAEVVWFRDALQPCVTLARLLARGRRPTAWYWPSAVPGWQAAPDVGRAIIGTIRAAAETEAGITGAGRVAGALLADDQLDTALRALTPADVAVILGSSPLYPQLVGVDTGDDADRPAPPPRLRPRWRRTIAVWTDRWGKEDGRSVCLVMLALAVELPALAASRHAPAAVRRTLDEATERAAAPALSGEPSMNGIRQADRAPHDPDINGVAVPEPTRRAALEFDPDTSVDLQEPETAAGWRETTPVHRLRDGSEPAGRDAALQRDGSGRQAAAAPPEPGAAASQAGRQILQPEGLHGTGAAGLAFLVPVLQAIGIAELIDRHEALARCDLPARLLERVAERCDIAEDDAARALLRAPADQPLPSITGFVAPAAWKTLQQGPSGRARIGANHRALQPGARADITRIENAVLLIAARFLRRHAHLSLRALVARTGRIAVTPTWVDVEFDAADADIRIRRAGLDIDPGWVPWLGKVVQFHYRDSAEHGREY